MTQLPPDTQEMLDSLRAAVAETLERKRRLGQYAVFWQDGKPVFIGEDALVTLGTPKVSTGAIDHRG